MLTHTIVVTKPISINKPHVTGGKLEKRKRSRLTQDLKNRQIKEGDTVYIESYGYGQVMEIITDYDQVSAWEWTAPLNVLVFVHDDQTEYFFNIFGLHKV